MMRQSPSEVCSPLEETDQSQQASDVRRKETDASFWGKFMQPLKKGELTRSRIVAEAASAFNQHGYAGTSMQDLMTATGLQKGGIYRHFESKEDLAAAAFEHAWNEVKLSRTHGLDEVPGAIAKLRFFVERFATTRPKLAGGCPLMNMAIEADDGNPALRGLALDALKEWQQQLQEIVAEGIRSGEIEPSTAPRQVANVIIATLEGALMISRLERSRDALSEGSLRLFAELDRICVHTGEQH